MSRRLTDCDQCGAPEGWCSCYDRNYVVDYTDKPKPEEEPKTEEEPKPGEEP